MVINQIIGKSFQCKASALPLLLAQFQFPTEENSGFIWGEAI